MESIKSPHVTLMAGLAICVATAILVICKIEDNRKNRDAMSTVLIGDDISSVESSQLMNRDLPRSTRRQRTARENLGVLSRLGYVLAADEIGDHKAEGKVHITAPDGRIFKSDSMSISSDGENILLHGWVIVVSGSGFVEGRSGADAFARIALDGSSQKFIGAPLYEPGSTFNAPYNVNSVIKLLPNQETQQAAPSNGG
jgi:hypothetical protein